MPSARAGRAAEGSDRGDQESGSGTDDASDRVRSELDRLVELGIDLIERHVYQLAGIVGVNPEPFTWRELDWMAEKKQSDQWDHTASVLTMAANAWSEKKKFDLSDFHPFLEAQKRKSMTITEYLDATEQLDKQRRGE